MVRRAALRSLLLVVLAAAVPGCMFLDVKQQQEKLQAACTIKGTARSAQEGNRTLVVVLLRRAEGEGKLAGGWDFVSQFVIEDAGRFKFGVPGGKGVYTVGAFDDANRNLTLDPDESFVIERDPVTCAPGANFDSFVLNVPAASDRRAAGLPALPAGSLKAQVSATLGQLTAIGELTSLAEDMFHQEVAESGLWRPFDFLVEGYAGIWFLEPYDPQRIPVLFVHGINGTPANFQDLIRNLDHKRFQAWVYYYPSGLHMGTVADHLNQTVIKLQVRYGVKRFAVVAHSMGGLVARGFIQRHYASSRSTEIPLFVSISTPWGGHAAAASGIKQAPVVVEVWHDMAPGSEYQKDIFGHPLPPGMQHHLLFTYQRNSSSFGQSDDQGVSVASQLARAAQKNAARTYGFDDTHMGVLRDPEVSALLNELLARTFYP